MLGRGERHYGCSPPLPVCLCLVKKFRQISEFGVHLVYTEKPCLGREGGKEGRQTNRKKETLMRVVLVLPSQSHPVRWPFLLSQLKAEKPGTDDGGHLPAPRQNYTQPTAHIAFPPPDLQKSKTCVSPYKSTSILLGFLKPKKYC